VLVVFETEIFQHFLSRRVFRHGHLGSARIFQRREGGGVRSIQAKEFDRQRQRRAYPFEPRFPFRRSDGQIQQGIWRLLRFAQRPAPWLDFPHRAQPAVSQHHLQQFIVEGFGNAVLLVAEPRQRLGQLLKIPRRAFRAGRMRVKT
ncbi:hypothetical protein C3L29_041280, partial [Pseudomonas sp. MWU12-2534b]